MKQRQYRSRQGRSDEDYKESASFIGYAVIGGFLLALFYALFY